MSKDDGSTDSEWLDAAAAKFKANPPSLPVKDEISSKQDQAERYQFNEELGRGGYGAVYRGYDRQLKRDVAIKQLHATWLSSRRHRTRFAREAAAAARVRGENVATVFDVQVESEQPFLVMELIRGKPLSKCRDSISVASAVDFVTQATEGLRAVHEAGLVHRDVKPSNILITEEGVAKVTDFGLASSFDPDAVDLATLAESPAGTIGYMSPEQFSNPGDLDPRSDIYSIGVMLFELLTGNRPFRGTHEAVIAQVLHDEPPFARRLDPDIPLDLSVIADKCLRQDRSERYESCDALLDDLKRYTRGEPISARPVSQVERVFRWCRRNPVTSSLSAALLLSLVIGVGGITYLANAWRKTSDTVHVLGSRVLLFCDQSYAWRRPQDSFIRTGAFRQWVANLQTGTSVP